MKLKLLMLTVALRHYLLSANLNSMHNQDAATAFTLTIKRCVMRHLHGLACAI